MVELLRCFLKSGSKRRRSLVQRPGAWANTSNSTNVAILHNICISSLPHVQVSSPSSPSQVSTDEKVKSDGCIAAFQTDTDKTSQRQSDCLITVMYLNVCVCVCVNGGGGGRVSGPCCDPWFGSIVWPSELTDGKPEPDFNTEILPCPDTDRQWTHP